MEKGEPLLSRETEAVGEWYKAADHAQPFLHFEFLNMAKWR